MSLTLLRTVAETQAWTQALLRQGKTLGLVPTMGFLHEGHLALMREAKRRADVVAVSIFVNPTQFGPAEDFSRYPRDLEGDLLKCESVGVDVIFAPEPADLYPEGFLTYVEVAELSRGLCGEKRPGHFRGVATVVAKLFALLRPAVAVFGEKDFQQLQVIKALARDLNLGVDVVGLPTVREADGLALSSRNAYLSTDERKRALAISRGLFAAQKRVQAGGVEVRDLVTTLRQELSSASLREDYVEVVDATTLKSISRVTPEKPARMLVAAFAGATRLIDNVGL
jgi:pantoate--beta-alanine ligase